MKKLMLILLMIMISCPIVYSQQLVRTDIEHVGDFSGTLGATGSASSSYTTFTSQRISWDCDTLSFIVEVASTDSLDNGMYANNDSLAIDLFCQSVSPKGLTDSTTIANFPKVLSKGATGGVASFGTAVDFPKNSKGLYGKVWGAVTNLHTAQRFKIRVYMVKKWRRR